MKTVVSTKGQIVLPAELRLQDDIRPGQTFEVQRIDRGEYRIAGRSMPVKDSLIAATALEYDLTIATRNAADFRVAGVKLFNPFN